MVQAVVLTRTLTTLPEVVSLLALIRLSVLGTLPLSYVLQYALHLQTIIQKVAIA
jgi:hypothetical protein